MPIAKVNRAVIAAARDPDRSALLLPAIKPIRKSVIGADVVELRGRLVIPRAPGLAAIVGNDRALIAAEKNHV